MNKKIEIEINNNIGDFILPRLRNAKRNIYIMSPWVSSSHIDLLVDKKSSGVDIKIITTNDYSNNSGALEKLLERDYRVVRKERTSMKYLGIGLFVIGFSLLVLPFFVKVKILFFLFLIPGIILYSLGRERRELFWISRIGEENLTIFSYNSFHLVHAKVYILDDLVIVGSANFTKNSFEHSLESIVLLEDEDVTTKTIERLKALPFEKTFSQVDHTTVGNNLQKSKTYSRYPRRYRRF